MENPYQAPDLEPVESLQREHRSFRLTSSDLSDLDGPDSTLSQAIVFALILQLPFLLLSGMILDGGWMFKRVVVAAVVFWTAALAVMIQNWKRESRGAFLWIKWGFLPTVSVTFTLWLLVETVLFLVAAN